jgi:aspartate-semialdehyde dehydrogenase
MAPDRHAQKIIIAGASSLLGAELKLVLEESRFAGWDLRLVDEEVAAGTLTEAGGEAAVIQRVEEGTFHGARYVFQTGSAEFAKLCAGPVREAGATFIDFSKASLSNPDATPWFPKLVELSGKSAARNSKTFCVFTAAGTALASLALGLREAGLRSLVAVLYHPVSEAGREGIEELESQTSQLLSFQTVGYHVFGTQVAFNLLPRFGEGSREDLRERLLEIRAEVSAAVGDAEEDARIALNMVHVPVFYGVTFSVCVELEEKLDAAGISAACKRAGFTIASKGELAPSNVSVAGESGVCLAEPEPDSANEGRWWIWGAADNLRLPAWSGCKLAEWLEG